MSNTLPDALLAMRDGLAGLAPAAKSVEVHRGRFRVADVSGVSMRTPALRLGLMGVRKVVKVASGERDVIVRLSCAIVTVDAKGLSREDAANALVNDLVLGIDGQVWGLDWAHAASDVAGENLFTGDVGRQGIMVWEVTWSQTLRLGANAFAEDGSLPPRLMLGQAPAVGAAHEADYEEVARVE